VGHFSVAFIADRGMMHRIMRPQDTTRAWLRYVIRQSNNVSIRQLAKGAKVDPSTLSRFLNDEDAEHDLSRRTIDGIVRFTGIPYGAHQTGGTYQKPSEPEAEPYRHGRKSNDTTVDEQVEWLMRSHPELNAWVICSRSLEVVGFLPGDIVMVNAGEAAEEGDIVLAETHDVTSELIFRVFQKPYLMAAALDRVPRQPIVVDDRRAVIRGVVVASFRARRGHLSAA
jgi:transcriptional regulator with XRE-family HTH domain